MINLDQIERDALEATQGKWHHFDGRIYPIQGDEPVAEVPKNSETNARHIANMDPETTLALRGEVRRLRKKIDMAEDKICDCDGMFDPDEFYGDLADSRQALGENNES